MATRPMSYLLFKLSLEMAYVGTFERDPWVQEQYQKYLDTFNNTQKKAENAKHSPVHSPNLLLISNTNGCR